MEKKWSLFKYPMSLQIFTNVPYIITLFEANPFSLILKLRWPKSNPWNNWKLLLRDYQKKVAKIIMKPYVSEYFLHFLTRITIDRSRTRFSWKWNIMVFLGKCWPICVHKHLCRVCNWWIALAIFKFSPCIYAQDLDSTKSQL